VADHACPCCRTALATGPDGTVYVAWRKHYEDGARDIVVAASPDRGQTFAPPVRVHRDQWAVDACPHSGPALAVAPAGRLRVAWFTGAEGRAAIYHASSPTPGLRFEEPSRLTPIGSPTSQVRAVGGEDGGWLAWEEATVAGPPALRLARVVGGRIRPLPANGLAGRTPAVASDGTHLAVVWSIGDTVRGLVTPLDAGVSGRAMRHGPVAALQSESRQARHALCSFFPKSCSQ
jgi:hypothetical protein